MEERRRRSAVHGLDETKPSLGRFSVGEDIELMKKNGDNIQCTVESITDESGDSIESVPHPGQRVRVRLSAFPEEQDILRRRTNTEG